MLPSFLMITSFPMAILLILLSCSLALGQSWPQSFQPTLPIHREARILPWNGMAHRYQSQHFLIESPEKMNPTQLRGFTQTIESVPVILKRFPLALFSPPRKGRPQVRIFNDDESFLKAGGHIGAAGVYDGRKQHVILRGKFFFSETGRARPNHDLLIHELTHLCMHEHLWKYDTWFHEGVAEYLAAAHTHEGSFRFNRIDVRIKDHLRAHLPPSQSHTQVTALADLVGLSSDGWRERVSKLPPAEVLEAYSSALLLIHYHFHGGEERLEIVKTYLTKIATVKNTQTPLPKLITPEEARQVQGRLERFWKPRGLRLRFR